MNSTDAEVSLWKEAIQSELDSLNKMGTWMKVSKYDLKGSRALPSHVILKIKRNEDGLADRFKARVVAGGNLQVMGRDVDDVSAPVADYAIVLLTLAIGLQMKWEQAHVDVKSAFLNGDIDNEIFVSHPYNLPHEFKRGHTYKLKKALYGLRQSPQRWFIKLRDTLINELQFVQLKTDGCIFTKKRITANESLITVIICYVDDLIFLSSNKSTLNKEILAFLEVFEGSKEELQWYLAVRIDKKDHSLEFSQLAYIEQALEEYNFNDINTYKTPLQANF